jgi:hypothetical protein
MGGRSDRVRLPSVSDVFEVEGTPARSRCRHCGDVIGVYEPIVLRAATGDRRTSIAAEPELFPTSDDCFHQACYRVITGWAPET